VYEKDAKGLFNISSGETTTMIDLAEAVLEMFPNSKSKIVFDKIADMEERRSHFYSIKKAQSVMGYEPQYNLKRGLNKIALFLGKSNG
jgi:nucleoside-diphosphate-sugar epimerase